MTQTGANSSALRGRIAELQQEIMKTTRLYEAAKRQRDSDRLIHLLKTRSALIGRLMVAQREFLTSIREAPGVAAVENQPTAG